MKQNILSILCIVFIMAGCKKDNYEKPSSYIKGRVIYQGEAIGVRSNGVQLELWQHGYQLFSKVAINVAQDGTFSANVFDGDYLITRLKGNGPWADQTDSVSVHLEGNANIDVPVTPYYLIKNATFSFNKADTSIKATFNVNQVTTGKAIEKISLSIGLTEFVDMTSNQIPFAPASVNDFNPPASIAQPITLTVSLNPDRYPDVASPKMDRAELRRQLGVALSTKYGFLRVGLKTVGVTERIYSQVQKLDLQ